MCSSLSAINYACKSHFLTEPISQNPFLSLFTLSFPLQIPIYPRALKTGFEGFGSGRPERDTQRPDRSSRPVEAVKEHNVDDDRSEMSGGDGDTWVHWEDQILEDTVPLVGFVRMILHSGKYESGDILTPEHERTILERLLPYHPHAEKKIGCGIDYITLRIKVKMRLLRGIVRPANFGIFDQFHHGQAIKILNSDLHSELIETYYVRGTNMQCREKSNAASATSDVEEIRKSSKRVPKGERKLMLESYVKKYKAMNDGKFPTVSDAQRAVGGSFYILREILMELKYNSSASLKGTTSVEKIHVKKDELLYDTDEIIRTKEASEFEQILEVGTKVPESLESKERAESSCPVQDIQIDENELSSSVNNKSKDIELHPQHPIIGPEVESSLNSDHKSKLQRDSLASYEVGGEKQETNGSERELKLPNDDIEPQRSTSMWKNLKSFANGILGFWRRS